VKNHTIDLSVYIIVLCYNSRKWLYKCINSLSKTNYSYFKILLVDNASTDGSIEEISTQFPEVLVIKNNRNYGWCQGNNIGIQYALERGADLVFLSNADMEYHQPEWLAHLIETYKQYPTYPVLGPLQYEYDDEKTLNEWSLYIMESGSRNVHYMWSDLLNTSKGSYEESALSSHLLDVYFVQGAAMLIHKSALLSVGLFDPLYYIFFDEVDFSRRNLRIGNRIALVPSSRVKHFGSGDNSSNRKMQWKRNYYFVRSKYYFHLSDYQMKSAIRWEVLKKWIKNDIKDALSNKEEISGIGQLLLIYFQVLIHLPDIIKKRRKELVMEQKIITSKVTDCIVKLIPLFTESDMNKNLNIDFGLDSIGMMELVIMIEEEFNLIFDVDVDMAQLYLPSFIVTYICEYQR